MSEISFLGDLMFGDAPITFGYGVYSTWSKKDYKGIFEGVSSVLNSSDFVVANFEAMIRTNITDKNIYSWSMCCEKNVCQELINNNIKICSVANNHTYDHKEEGFKETVENLENNGIAVIGKRDKPYTLIASGGHNIAIVGASYIQVFDYENAPYFINPTIDDWKRVKAQIGDMADYIIAFVHWGSEFVEFPTNKQLEIKDTILDAGIDDIVGCHPHILQTNQLIGKHHVFYSLGNFVSDYWQKRLRRTMILQLDTISMQYRQINCEINTRGGVEVDSLVDEIEYTDVVDTKRSVILKRFQMRIEYGIKAIGCFLKVKGKRKYVKWLLERIGYVFTNIFNEIKNPDSIYEKYKV